MKLLPRNLVSSYDSVERRHPSKASHAAHQIILVHTPYSIRFSKPFESNEKKLESDINEAQEFLWA